MSETKKLLKETIPTLIAFLVGSIFIISLLLLQYLLSGKTCLPSDIYKIGVWSKCSEDNFQYRSFIKDESVNCSNIGEIEIPEIKRICNYIPECKVEDFKLDEGLCNDGIIKINATKLIDCEGGENPPLTKTCMQTYLFKEGIKEHTTIITPNKKGEGEYGSGNIDNVSLMLTGTLDKAKLILQAKTTKKNGDLIKIDEFYYVLFSLGKININNIPKALGTSRVRYNEFDTNDYGIFQGTETPKTLEFNLKDLKCAENKGKIGSTNIDIVSILNNNVGKILPITLYLGDGRSMTELDDNKRIFGTIYNAYIEYSCENGSECSIKSI